METDLKPIVVHGRKENGSLSCSIVQSHQVFYHPNNGPIWYKYSGGSLIINPAVNIFLSERIDPTFLRDLQARGYHPENDIDPRVLLGHPTDIITLN